MKKITFQLRQDTILSKLNKIANFSLPLLPFKPHIFLIHTYLKIIKQ